MIQFDELFVCDWVIPPPTIGACCGIKKIPSVQKMGKVFRRYYQVSFTNDLMEKYPGNHVVLEIIENRLGYDALFFWESHFPAAACGMAAIFLGARLYREKCFNVGTHQLIRVTGGQDDDLFFKRTSSLL